ncbi:hypothetical protein ElyMa_004670800 [Elysia marginata]|uniref:Uncharacterized protein n=1 Tax=Elysia marginata TaxID=1093978 RepID=A0AAV4I3E7_9GAST|nr:hypothetical protein ElyMa_004670800 [Elysia marginata]
MSNKDCRSDKMRHKLPQTGAFCFTWVASSLATRECRDGDPPPPSTPPLQRWKVISSGQKGYRSCVCPLSPVQSSKDKSSIQCRKQRKQRAQDSAMSKRIRGSVPVFILTLRSSFSLKSIEPVREKN